MVDKLTPDEQAILSRVVKDGRGETLIWFLDNYRAGRRVACWFVHFLVGLGALGGIIAGLYQGAVALINLKTGHWAP